MFNLKNIVSYCIVVCVCLPSLSILAIEDTAYLQDPEHQFWFDISDLPTIKLSFAEDQWALLLTSTRDEPEEVSCDFLYSKNGQQYLLQNIGIKLSGNTSFVLPETSSDPFVQANFTLDFDEFIDDQQLSGIAAMKLKRFKDDSTFVHEPLSNQIMHNFDLWTAHSSTYVRLEITVGQRGNNYYGLYRINESVNRNEYIDKRFGSDNNNGFLWQGNYKDWGPAHFSRINADWGGVSESGRASFEYKGKGSKFAEAKAQLVDMAENFTQLSGAEFEQYIEQHLNVSLFLKSMAAEAVLGHWDGFWGNGNNYMFYIDENEKLHFIPFDTDNTLGTSLILGDVGERDPLQFGLSSSSPLLLNKIMAIGKYQQEYSAYLKSLVIETNLMDEDYALDWIRDAHQLIGSDLSNITGDNQQILDRPAAWGNQSSYRIFDLASGKNWYQTRRSAILEVISKPDADAGADIVISAGETAQFNGANSSDPDGEIIRYEWSNGLSGVNPIFTYSDPGTFSVTLTVTDDLGVSASDEVVVTVQAIAVLPIVPEVKSSGGGGLSIYNVLIIFIFSLCWRLRPGRF